MMAAAGRLLTPDLAVEAVIFSYQRAHFVLPGDPAVDGGGQASGGLGNRAHLDGLADPLWEAGAYGNQAVLERLALRSPAGESPMLQQQQQQLNTLFGETAQGAASDHLGDPLVGGPGDKDKKKKKKEDKKPKAGVSTSKSGTVATANLGGDRGSVSVTGQSSASYTTAKEDGTSHSVGYNKDKSTVSHTQTTELGDVTGSRTHAIDLNGNASFSESVKDRAGNKKGHSTTVGKDGVAHSRSSEHADGRSSSTSVAIGPEAIQGSHYEDNGRGKSGAGIAAKEGELTVSGMDRNNGASMTIGKDKAGIGVEAIRGKTTYTAGASYDGETGKTTVSMGAKTKKVGGQLVVSVGDGEVDADLGVSGKIAKASVGGTYINKDEDGVTDSPLLGGDAYSVGNTSGGGVRASAQYVIGGKGGYLSTEQVRVQQKMGEDGTLGAAAAQQTRAQQAALMAGERLDVTQMPVGQGVEVAQASTTTAGVMADAALLSADGTADWSEVRSRGLARTEEGYRVVDQTAFGSEVDGSAAASLVLFDVLEGGYQSSYADKETLEFNLDACDPDAIGYAQAYADLGLLPSWDIACEEYGQSDLISRIHGALTRIAQPGADLNNIKRRVAGDVTQANAYVRMRVHQEGARGDCGVEYTHAGTETAESSAASWDFLSIIGGGTTSSEGETRQRKVGTGGAPYLDVAWSEAEDTGYQKAAVSGAVDAEAALSVQVKHDNRTDVEADLQLSADAVKLLGGQLNASASAGQIWAGLRQQAVSYWQMVIWSREQAIDFQRQYPDTLPPPGMFPFSTPGTVVRAPGSAEQLSEVFGKIQGVEDFLALSPALQAAFVESAVVNLDQPGAQLLAPETALSPLDALAAVSVMEEGESRGAALAGVARALTADPEGIDQDIQATASRLGGGSRTALELAREGIAADVVGMDQKDPAAWAEALRPLFDGARGSHADADALMARLQDARAAGGAGMLAGVLDALGGAEAVAHRFALKSGWQEGSRLYTFVDVVLDGHAAQAGLRESWQQVALVHNPDVIHREETGRSMFENATDGNGLGDCGVSWEQRQIWAEQAAAIEPLSPEEMAKLREEEIAAAKFSANLLAGKSLHDALRDQNPSAFLAALETFRDAAGLYPVEALDGWAWNNRALIYQNIGRLRRYASDSERNRISTLLRGAAGWEMAEKVAPLDDEVPQKTDLQLSIGL